MLSPMHYNHNKCLNLIIAVNITHALQFIEQIVYFILANSHDLSNVPRRSSALKSLARRHDRAAACL